MLWLLYKFGDKIGCLQKYMPVPQSQWNAAIDCVMVRIVGVLHLNYSKHGAARCSFYSTHGLSACLVMLLGTAQAVGN